MAKNEVKKHESMVRLEEDLHNRIKCEADNSGLSFNKMIGIMAEEYFSTREEKAREEAAVAGLIEAYVEKKLFGILKKQLDNVDEAVNPPTQTE